MRSASSGRRSCSPATSEGRTQTLPLVVYGEFQGGDLDQSIAAAAILVLAAFGVLVAVRFFHWGRVLDIRGIA